MGIIGMNFKSFEASAEEKKVSGNIDINSVPLIESVRKKDVKLPGIDEVVSIEFKFVTTYTPNIGSIRITGEILYQTDDAKKVVSSWDGKKLDDKIAVDVLNAILKKCLSKAVSLADELRLPPPVSFPVVKTNKKDSEQML